MSRLLRRLLPFPIVPPNRQTAIVQLPDGDLLIVPVIAGASGWAADVWWDDQDWVCLLLVDGGVVSGCGAVRWWPHVGWAAEKGQGVEAEVA